ncbi:protein no-on-transient A-like isoform X1 [Drosophila albomicans]|uniref:Protein no-on-transient A-like isoform X1 n=1 Tax=Drosophila albomicans TaxID=7291 RepID=A0A6P8XGK6_DROAB|nr:protein no-on-transient A-like isoform X1 [Drosophila albomicans]XP_051858372.1 protein no-on-transient A-like isoform X1 [Drosophila albomicans]
MNSENISKPNEEPKMLGKRRLEDQDEISETAKKGRIEQGDKSWPLVVHEPNNQVAQLEGLKAFRNRVSGGVSRNSGYNNNNNNKDLYFIEKKLQAIEGPNLELESMDIEEFRFSNRNRLYVGNMPKDMGKEKLKEMFEPYGEINDLFVNVQKNLAFLKMEFHQNAVKAKRALDGSIVNGRTLRVRFAPSHPLVRVTNLSDCVSNELLHKGFEIFGPIERAVVVVDNRGNHKGEGIVEFVMRSSAMNCLSLCQERCFLLTAKLRPCIVEPLEINDDDDGMSEKMIAKSQAFNEERSVGPRFADLCSFEHEYATEYKCIIEYYKKKAAALQRELKYEEQKLEDELDYARTMRETELLRKELKRREADEERRKLELRMRHKQSQQLFSLEADPFHHQSDLLAPRFSRNRETGFGGFSDYNSRDSNLNSSPFVVFGDPNENSSYNQHDEVELVESYNISDSNYSTGNDTWNGGQSGIRHSLD